MFECSAVINHLLIHHFLLLQSNKFGATFEVKSGSTRSFERVALRFLSSEFSAEVKSGFEFSSKENKSEDPSAARQSVSMRPHRRRRNFNSRGIYVLLAFGPLD